MNPISTSNTLNSTSVQQKKSSAQHQKPANTSGKATTNKDGLKLPEDIVNLSMASKGAPAEKKPSIPVTSAEKDALLHDLPDTSISIYV
jgi:hypothetical protein